MRSIFTMQDTDASEYAKLREREFDVRLIYVKLPPFNGCGQIQAQKLLTEAEVD